MRARGAGQQSLPAPRCFIRRRHPQLVCAAHILAANRQVIAVYSTNAARRRQLARSLAAATTGYFPYDLEAAPRDSVLVYSRVCECELRFPAITLIISIHTIRTITTIYTRVVWFVCKLINAKYFLFMNIYDISRARTHTHTPTAHIF